MFDEARLKNAKHIHFIGIGGSGMFPLVQILHDWGYRITGSDNNDGSIVRAEQEMGIPVHLKQCPENLEGADFIVYTAAILEDNPELVAARASGKPLIERAELLGWLSRQYRDCICVCGTHGKTTTTAMLTQMLVGARLDPTAVIGGKLAAIGGYGRVGKSQLMACEACEFQDHFLKLSPSVAVLLNIDNDHLDYFGTVENAIHSFHRFAGMASRGVIVNGSDANAMKAVADLPGQRVVTFGWEEGLDYVPTQVRHEAASSSFLLLHRGQPLGHFTIHVPGRHNILNAVAAIAAALEVGAPLPLLQEHLAQFHGAGRRFEILGEVQGVTVADDYAHHPTELAATLQAAKELPFRRVWAVFQPFTYSRTKLLMEEFAQALQLADRVVLSEIMGSREKNTDGVYASQLAEKIPGAVWFPTFPEIAAYVRAHAQPGDLVLTLGCGDVYKCAHLILEDA